MARGTTAFDGWAPNSADGLSRGSTRPDGGRRNCKVNPDDLRRDRPDLHCEPQQARAMPRNLQLDETPVLAVWRFLSTAWLPLSVYRP